MLLPECIFRYRLQLLNKKLPLHVFNLKRKRKENSSNCLTLPGYDIKQPNKNSLNILKRQKYKMNFPRTIISINIYKFHQDEEFLPSFFHEKRIAELAEEFNIVDPIKHHSTTSKCYTHTSSDELLILYWLQYPDLPPRVVNHLIYRQSTLNFYKLAALYYISTNQGD